MGSHESSLKICNHIERYIIREDASIYDRSNTHALLVIGDGPVDHSKENTGQHAPNLTDSGIQIDDAGPFLFGCYLPILDAGSCVVCYQRERVEEAERRYVASGSQLCSEQLFQWLRISNFWPLHPSDIGEKTIPQELDCDARAISFTKGCYLGQETIARLDARGQLQKKLCRLEISHGDLPQQLQIGDQLMAGDKEVGQITSIAKSPEGNLWRALALLRRGNFLPGTELQCLGHIARVL